MSSEIKVDVVVLGSGPGGYSAAFRAADLGKKVALVERYDTLGGVCLNVGCIPSKALLHAAKVIAEAKEMEACGIEFGAPKLDFKKLLSWKDSVVKKLTGGLNLLAKKRKVTVLTGTGQFSSPNTMEVTTPKGKQTIAFESAIIAAGSKPVQLKFIPEDPRIMDSTDALLLDAFKSKKNPRLLVIGGGIIGLEMATVYHSLGAKVSIVEQMDQLVSGADKDLISVYQKHVEKQYDRIMLETRVTGVKAEKAGLVVSFEGKNAPGASETYDTILVAVGRTPNGHEIGAEKAGVQVDDRGFISVDKQQKTNVPHIYAIGDIVGQPMLAHKAVPEGRLAAEVIAGKKHFFDAQCIPAVAYTDPEIAWVGLTELEAKAQGVEYGKGMFPWAASGRALGVNRPEGMTKLLFDKKTHRVIGGGIVGVNAGELIGEVGLAIEMGCDAEDIALTVHAHPTLSETIMLSSEVFEGTITDL